MSDQSAQPAAPTTEGTAKMVYILYLVGLLFGITGIIGVIMAYINKSDAPEWLASHYQFQIKTFWLGAIFFLVGFITAFIGVGILILLFWAIWLIVRCVKGIKFLDLKQAHPNPGGLWFS